MLVAKIFIQGWNFPNFLSLIFIPHFSLKSSIYQHASFSITNAMKRKKLEKFPRWFRYNSLNLLRNIKNHLPHNEMLIDWGKNRRWQRNNEQISLYRWILFKELSMNEEFLSVESQNLIEFRRGGLDGWDFLAVGKLLGFNWSKIIILEKLKIL